MNRSFLILLVAVLFEVIGTSALKQSAGFTKPGPIAVVVGSYASTFILMSFAMKDLPLNMVYSVWSGLGTAGIAIIGWLFFKEPLTAWAVVGISMIVGGVFVLHAVGMPHGGNGP
jgi:small multidrug resistance pump